MKTNQIPAWRQNRINNIIKQATEDLKTKNHYFGEITDFLTSTELDQIRNAFSGYNVTQDMRAINTDDISILIQK